MDNRNYDRQQFEDWHRYGKERGFFDRAADTLRSWFGDEDAERRRKMDSDVDESRGHAGRQVDQALPSWQQKGYAGSSPRGSEWDERGRFAYEDSGMARRQQGQQPRYGSQHSRSDSGYGGYPQQYGSEEQWERRPENYRSYLQGRDNETGMGWGENRHLGGGGWRTEHEGRGTQEQNWERQQRPEYRGTMGGEQRGGFFGGGQEGAGMFGSGNKGKGPRNYQRSDERILDEISQIVTFHPDIDATDLEIAVDKGVVTLRGKVDSRTAKRLTEDVVEDVYGVREVHNEIRVESGMFKRATEPTPRNNLVNK